jgi:hypothetical protein
MNWAHSSSVGVRYSSLGRRARRRAMNSLWLLITSRELTELVFYALRDGHIRRLTPPPPTVTAA